MITEALIFIKNLNEKKIFYLLLGITFALRLYAVLMAQGIANDSAAYGFMARDFMKGNFVKALSIPGHPLYPLWMSFISPAPCHVEIAGRLISLFFGTLTLIVIFYLIKRTIGEKEAYLTALFYTFHPYLVNYSGMMLTEATYWGLLIISVYFFWTALEMENTWRMIPAGIFLGLSYLTRPEGIGYIVVYIIWVVIIAVKKNRLLKGLLQLVYLTIFTFIFVFPYVFYIRHETGQWLISKKALGFQSQLISKELEESNIQIKQQEDTKKNNPSENSNKNNPGENNSKLTWVKKNVLLNFPYVIYHYLRAFHFALWIFLFFGLIRVRRSNIKFEIFVASMILFHLLSLSTFTKSTIRFSVPVIPISLFWAALGAIELKRFLLRIKKINPEKLVFLLTVLIILIQLPQALKPERRHRAYQKEVGLWLKHHTPPDAIIMSNTPQEVFYAEREFVIFPKDTENKDPLKSYYEVIEFAKKSGVRYILIDKNIHEFSPGFVEMMKSKDLPELKEIYRKSDQELIIYEVIY